MRPRMWANMEPIMRPSSSGTMNVRMGLRPPGSSVSHEMSRSPNQVIAAVRGIGVAVMTSRCGTTSFLVRRDSRCSTPNRCCSSMTTSARFGAWNVLENAACVATMMHGSPLAASARARRRAASFMPPVSRMTGTCRVFASDCACAAPSCFPLHAPLCFTGCFTAVRPLASPSSAADSVALIRSAGSLGDRASRDGSSPVWTPSIAQSMALMVA